MIENLNTPMGLFCFLLSLGVIFVNGWTDAPNSISSVVSTGVLRMSYACILSGVMNFLGVIISSALFHSVAESIFEISEFKESKYFLEGVSACFLTIIIFGVACWLFGLPSSESHAMVSAILGVSIALGYDSLYGIYEILKIILFMLLSSVFSFFLSFFLGRCLKSKSLPYKSLGLISALSTAFMHGCQDGQKFIGLLMILFVGKGKDISPLVIIIVSVMMLLGTLLGGGRIIKSLGEKTVKLNFASSFVSDFSAFISLLLSTIFGMPVSTGNIKATSVMGGGSAFGERVNKKMVCALLGVSLLTFPACLLLGFLLTKLLLL